MNLQKWVRILLPEIQLFDYVQAKGFTGKKTKLVRSSISVNSVRTNGQQSPISNIPENIPHSSAAVKEVLQDAKAGVKQFVLNRSNDELDAIFKEIKNVLNGEILGQGSFIDELLVSYKKAFFKRAKGTIQNTILVSGPTGTGKMTAISLLINQLYKKKLVPYNRFAKIDLQKYSEADIHTNFITDCLAAFEYGIGTVCFTGIENSNSQILDYIAKLFSDGYFRTSNGIMIDASNYFLLLYLDADSNENERGQLPQSTATKIPTVILNGIQSFALSTALQKEDLAIILRKKLIGTAQKLEKQAQLFVTFNQSVFSELAERILATKRYGAAIQDFVEKDFYQVLVDLRAREVLNAGDQVFIKINEDVLIAAKAGQSFPLKSVPLVKEEKIEDLLAELNSLTGLEGVKHSVTELLETVKIQKARQDAGYKKADNMAMHMVFTGNPGTGKTTVARLVSRILKAIGLLSQGQLVEVSRQDLVGEYLGSTAPKTNQVIQRALGGVLFIDEAYTLSREKQDPFGLEAIDTLVKGMEDFRDDIVVVIAGYTNEMEGFLKSNPGLKSRFPFLIEFPDYTSEEMFEILNSMVGARDFNIEPELREDLLALFESKQISGRNDSGNGRLVRNTLEEAIRKQAVRLINETGYKDLKLLTAQDFGIAAKKPFDIDASFNKIIGLENVKNFVRTLQKQILANQKRRDVGIVTEQSQTLNLVFSGNPGTGKTTMARLLAEMLKSMGLLKQGHLVEVGRQDLVSEYMGQTAVKTTEVLEKSLGGVLFIDEVYSLNEEGVQGGGFGKEAIDTIVRFIENYREDLVVVLAGYTEDMERFMKVNPGLSSRFPLKIEFPDYTPEQLAEMTELLSNNKGFFLASDVNVRLIDFYNQRQILGKNDSGNGRLVRNTIEQAIRNQAIRIVENAEIKEADLNQLTLEDFQLTVHPENGNAMDELQSIIGLDSVKDFVKALSAQIEVANRRKEMGLPDMSTQSLHLIFKGNPGTGKTTIARILAKRLKELGVIKLDNIVETDRSGLVAGYIGQTALKTREVLEKALGGILFVDEAYALAGGSQDFGQEAIDTIVKFMDDHRDNIIVILAGYEDDMDRLMETNAGLRSRFPNMITFPDYSVDELILISRNILKPKGYELSLDGLMALRDILENYSGDVVSGNGRLARNICEAAIRQHALRISQNSNPTIEDLTLLKKEDFLKVGVLTR
ncbi:AAA family ATPase [Bacillus salipaludis]|uniref:AAA family ATPase n=1 Tax=Bacillus salipaludis TaxID=2547811 RepID=A0AA90QTS4_9BACI|nr:AAA family ATPase [Bacillus salipaludis]MDQ6598112.1 AAA family ATPase [Bacillus salipaludis]